MNALQKRRLKLCFVAVILNLLFIWGNSLMPGEISAAFSRFVGNIISFLFPGDGEEIAPSGEGILRKIAHILEFCSLGFLLSLIMTLVQKPLMIALPLGMFAGAVDECIQLLVPDRGPHIRDVGIDTLGVFAGIGLCALILALRRRKKQSALEEN